MNQPTVHLFSLSTIIPNETNPRLIKDYKFQQLCASIRAFPEMLSLRPIVVDESHKILGGNMRYMAAQQLGIRELPVVIAEGLTEEQKKEFIIKDNLAYGEWNWEILSNEWETEKLQEWGLDVPGFSVEGAEELPENFSLADGAKLPFQQMTFTLADEQATVIKNALEEMKSTDLYQYAETMGNDNANGNALYLIVSEWTRSKKS